jgi:SAM-dependent methyltransferase
MREASYGEAGLTMVDRFGVALSRGPVLSVIRRYQRPDVLDLGCGYHARLLHDLLPLIGRGAGVDVTIAPTAADARLTFYEQPIDRAIPVLRGQHFDVILLVSVLEHLSEPQVVLRDCFDLLRPGGALVLNVPNWIGKFFLEFSAFRLGLSPAVEMDDHKMYYNKRDLWPLLVRAGFKPSRIHMRYHKFGLNLFAVAARATNQ